MSKITLFAKIKLFISSHLVPVIATSAILVVGVSAGVVAIVLNSQPKQETSSNQEDTDLAQNPENEKPKQEDETNNKTENSDPDTDAGDKSAEQNTSKPNTSQNQNSGSSQTKPVEKPSNSNTNSSSNNSSSSQTPAPSQPTAPTQPTKTEYFYVCKGTIPDPNTKAQMLAEFPGADDHITLTLNGPRKVASCWDEFKNSSMVDPNYTKYFTWQLIECNSFEEMNSYLN